MVYWGSTRVRNAIGQTARTLLIVTLAVASLPATAQRTTKPVLHGRHWMAITGKPLAATAGSMMFQKGGNAVDAACAMLGATSTMFDALSWGGETQALIYVPDSGKVVGINALGVAPTGATPEYFRSKKMPFPPEYGPLAAVTPGTPGGLLVMLAEFGRLSLAEVLAPSIDMADGYPIEAQSAWGIERNKAHIKKWRTSKKLFLPHLGEDWEAPHAGEIFRQPALAATLRKLVEAEAEALAAGKTRREAIYAAYERFYRGDIAADLVSGSQEAGGLHTLEDLDRWEVFIEEPVSTDYKGVEVFKLTSWVQGPVMIQALNMLSELDLQSLGYNTTRYIHGLYQVMSLAFADRDFYYGDPYFPPEEPLEGLLSQRYAKARVKGIDWHRNDPDIKPGDPYPYQGGKNPYREMLDKWDPTASPLEAVAGYETAAAELTRSFEEGFLAGTTSIQAADEEGWVVSVTPSGGWVPTFIAGKSGIGLSQRMQSFVLDAQLNPFNVLEPGKRPRATLTPSLALKDGTPFLSFAVQGGDTQDQNLLQFLLNVVDFGMTAQEAAEAANITSFQMRSSFDDHRAEPGRIRVHASTPVHVRRQLLEMGYRVGVGSFTSGPITAIHFDRETGTMWGAASDFGDDYGIAW
ncbi:MAG: gamma-glutamyltransferase [Acidobacteriota bacterium]|nr:gamma-glutamyltransferase [Acidobacteriota bacterium]